MLLSCGTLMPFLENGRLRGVVRPLHFRALAEKGVHQSYCERFTPTPWGSSDGLKTPSSAPKNEKGRVWGQIAVGSGLWLSLSMERRS